MPTTLNIPCPDRSICVESPLSNLSSDGIDGHVFIGEFFPPIEPPLISEFFATACGISCRSTISQDDADLCAARLAMACQGNRACNTEQVCCVICPDGTEFCYTVPPCTIFARTVDEANQIAHSLACVRANETAMCISGELDDACLGESYSSTLTLSGGSAPFVWNVVGGVLPPGLSMLVSPDGRHATFSGTPNTAGSFEFSVRAADQLGNFMINSFQVSVVAITTATNLPSGVKAVAYSFPIEAIGGSSPYTFVQVSGTIPPGLTLAEDGTLSGTPTTSGTYLFTVTVTDSSA